MYVSQIECDSNNDTKRVFEVFVCVLEVNVCVDDSVCYAVDGATVEDPKTTACCWPDAKQSGHVGKGQ